ncbi:MAG: TolC family protein [Planctomycetales bacterium]|nr:TolC family protein [Planctomycetales bacterium]
MDPKLPLPAPQLYGYELPGLVTSASEPRNLNSSSTSVYENLQSAEPIPSPELEEPIQQSQSGNFNNVQSTQDAGLVAGREASQILLTSAQSAQDVIPQQISSSSTSLQEASDEELGIRIVPIPEDAWLSLPATCLRRMLEFSSVREEFTRTFESNVDESQLDDAARVNLENILELALINSRDYQTRKETLYRTALSLTLQRFDYQRKFFSSGNGTALNYRHNRVGGIEVNTLGVPTGLGITRSLYTAGDLVARFANDVVLTFNGSSGFTSSVGSEMLVSLTQPLIQRDVQFEALTQAERDVVYAARDFVRFRKSMFRDLANQYYSLLLTYRSIAINTQDYFSNLRGFNRGTAMEQVGQIPRYQVDQFEQNALRSRGNLINSCNRLEQSLDELKLVVGLPTELPLNLDLSELEELTLRDEATVIREQIKRRRTSVVQQQAREGIAVAIAGYAELSRRMLNLANVLSSLGETQDDDVQALELLVAQLELEDSRVTTRQNVEILQKGLAAGNLLPTQALFRHTEVVELLLSQIRREILMMSMLTTSESDDQFTDSPQSGAQIDQLIAAWAALNEQSLSLERRYFELPNDQQLVRLDEFLGLTKQLQNEVTALDQLVTARLSGRGVELAEDDSELQIIADGVIELSRSELFTLGSGLAKLEIDMDEATLTALVQRLDLMNTRGDLADAWRQIKYAGDGLKSVLDLQASQSIRTPTGSGDPFEFTFKDSTTTLGLQFDTPLNRRRERNVFRLALINYNVALRRLIDAQDRAKLQIRNDIRAIELDRNQYDIAIASAALAYERVVSTRLQLVTPGAGNITARDFLEAQQAYTQSLSSVAQQHVEYILDRIQLFLDLEQLQVDELNYWADLRNEDAPFIPNTDFLSTTPDGYGCLPEGPWYSDCLRRMEQVPSGQSVIFKEKSTE